MSASNDHLNWAEAHARAADAIMKTGQHAWSVVACFYSGLHMVHAALPHMQQLSVAQQHPENHTGRTFQSEGTCVVIDRYVSSLSAPYRSLFDGSIDVRYNGHQPTRAEAEAHRTFDLQKIAKWACSVIHTPQPCDCWLIALV